MSYISELIEINFNTMHLEKINESHAHIVAEWMLDEEYINFVSGDPLNRSDTVTSMVHIEIENSRTNYPHSLTLVAIDNLSGLAIGLVHFYEIDWISKSSQIQFSLGASNKRRSIYGAKLVALAVEFAYSTLNMQNIAGIVYVENIYAIKLYDRFAEHTGTLKEHAYINGKYTDALIYQLNIDSYHKNSFIKTKLHKKLLNH
jgi:RimJ/RimL family protein N-acetyltransferase